MEHRKPNGPGARGRLVALLPREVARDDAVRHGLDDAERDVGPEPRPAPARHVVERIVRARTRKLLGGLAGEGRELDLGALGERGQHGGQTARRVERDPSATPG